MQRDARLRAQTDFKRVQAEGRSWPHRLLVLLAAPGPDPTAPARIGIVASKRVGAAVVRNRARRRLREVVRLRLSRIAPGWDLVFIVRAAAVGAPHVGIVSAVESVLARAGLWSAEAACDASPSA